MNSKCTKEEVDRGGSVQRADASEVKRLVRRELRVYSLVDDEIYDWKGEQIQLHAGDTFCGGMDCEYPAAKQYSTVCNHKRIWFRHEDVEDHPERFQRLFA